MTHCAQAGTLSPRTTEPPVVHKELAEVLANPVIAVVRSAEELAEALTSRVAANVNPRIETILARISFPAIVIAPA